MDFGSRQDILTNGSVAIIRLRLYNKRQHSHKETNGRTENYQSIPFTPGQERRERQRSAEGATQGTLPEGDWNPVG
jgi:hypothetical protein